MKYLALLLLAGCLEPLPMEDGLQPVDAGRYVCSPFNCSGCCRNNICRGGNDNDACGYSGRYCNECTGNAKCEAPGTCIGYGSLPNRPTPDSGCFVVENKLLCW